MKNSLKLGLLPLLLSVASVASAYGPAGPFQSVSELETAWDSFSPSSAALAYLDGNVVYSRGGFGPTATGNYVSCSGGTIYQDACPSAPSAVLCLCEHLGSQWDGICEAYTYPTPLAGNETFSWTPFGQAWLVSASPSSAPFGIYNVNPGGTGGLSVTIHFANGQSSSNVQCAAGT